jgi:hypothetical protein
MMYYGTEIKSEAGPPPHFPYDIRKTGSNVQNLQMSVQNKHRIQN